MKSSQLTAVETHLDFYEIYNLSFQCRFKTRFTQKQISNKHFVTFSEILIKNVGLLKYFNIQDGASVFL